MINSTDNNIRVVPTVCHGFAVQFSFPSLAMGTDSCIRIADIKKKHYHYRFISRFSFVNRSPSSFFVVSLI